MRKNWIAVAAADHVARGRRFGLFEVRDSDFERIAAAMGARLAA